MRVLWSFKFVKEHMKTHTQIYKEWLAPVIKVGKVVPLTEKYAYPFAIALT